jgi:hypothetical protein
MLTQQQFNTDQEIAEIAEIEGMLQQLIEMAEGSLVKGIDPTLVAATIHQVGMSNLGDDPSSLSILFAFAVLRLAQARRAH